MERSMFDITVLFTMLNDIKTKSANDINPISHYDKDNMNYGKKYRHLYYDDSHNIGYGKINDRSYFDYSLIYKKNEDGSYIYYSDLNSPIGSSLDIFVRIEECTDPYIVIKSKPSINTFSHFDKETITIQYGEMKFSGDETNV